MTIKKNIKIEIGVITAIMLIGLLSGSKEMTNLFKQDIGFIIMGFGGLWLIGVVFRLNEWLYAFCSLFCAGAVFLFGFGLHEYGFFAGVGVLGVFFLIAAYLTNPIKPNVAMYLLICGLFLGGTGYSFRYVTSPTSIELKGYDPITYTNAVWTVSLQYQDVFISVQNDYGEWEPKTTTITLATITGSEEQAYLKAHEVIPQWRSYLKANNALPPYKSYSDLYIIDIDVYLDLSSCPKEYRKNYMSSDKLVGVYAREHRPWWTNLTQYH